MRAPEETPSGMPDDADELPPLGVAEDADDVDDADEADEMPGIPSEREPPSAG